MRSARGQGSSWPMRQVEGGRLMLFTLIISIPFRPESRCSCVLVRYFRVLCYVNCYLGGMMPVGVVFTPYDAFRRITS